jgi:glycerophosphoryl diester phosphodiesterase
MWKLNSDLTTIKKREKRIQFFICLLVVGVGFVFAVGESQAKCPTRMGSEFLQDSFLVIAHRGAASKFPENTLPAFKEALNGGGANSLLIDLSLTQDKQVVLWHDWDPNHPTALYRQRGEEPIVKYKPFGPTSMDSPWRKKVSELTFTELKKHYGYKEKITNIQNSTTIVTFPEFIDWAVKQEKLQSVLLKLRVPAGEGQFASIMLEEIRRVISDLPFALQFDLVFMIPHQDILRLVKGRYSEFKFSYDREIPTEGVVNYHRSTAIPVAMQFKNSYAGLGLSILPSKARLDPWITYRFILTMDLKLRDNYKKSTSQYIKIISWTLNDAKKMRCLIHLGVNGIVTDQPERLRKIALELGKTLD